VLVLCLFVFEVDELCTCVCVCDVLNVFVGRGQFISAGSQVHPLHATPHSTHTHIHLHAIQSLTTTLCTVPAMNGRKNSYWLIGCQSLIK
jgi:hypothetical protein